VTADATDSEAAAEVGYADAVAELNSILRDLEDDELDIDVLADRVERAADLISICRDRIGVAKLKVSEIVASIDPDADEQSNGQ